MDRFFLIPSLPVTLGVPAVARIFTMSRAFWYLIIYLVFITAFYIYLLWNVPKGDDDEDEDEDE